MSSSSPDDDDSPSVFSLFSSPSHPSSLSSSFEGFSPSSVRLRDIPNISSPLISPSLSFPSLSQSIFDFSFSLFNDFRPLGVRPQMTAMIFLPSAIDFVITFISLANLNLKAAPIDYRHGDEEIHREITHLNPQIVITDEEGKGKILKIFDKKALPKDLHVVTFIVKKQNKQTEAKEIIRYGLTEKGFPSSPSSPFPLFSSLRWGDFPFGRPSSPLLTLMTSGTTGNPKKVIISHRAMYKSIQNIIHHYNITPSDCTVVCLPLHHVHGLLFSCLSPLFAGADISIVKSFSSQGMQRVLNVLPCSFISMVPAMWEMFLRSLPPPSAISSPPFPSLRFVRSCSAAIQIETLRKIEEKLECPAIEAYACTENCHQITSNRVPPKGTPKNQWDFFRTFGSVGGALAQSGISIEIVDATRRIVPPLILGEVAISSPSLFSSYEMNPKSTVDSFVSLNGRRFFLTGDEGFVDAEKRLFLRGRLKEQINRGGEKISPLEIEENLQRAFRELGVSCIEFAVFPQKDSIFGETVGFVGVFTESPNNEILIKILRILKVHLNHFKIPTFFAILPQSVGIPRSPIGKIQRIALHKQLENIKMKWETETLKWEGGRDDGRGKMTEIQIVRFASQSTEKQKEITSKL